MIGILRTLGQTFQSFWRPTVTIQYPDVKEEKTSRFAGFPGLRWDFEVGEPSCMGCRLCERNCPTEAIRITVKDNPLFAEGKSKRRKIVDEFEIDVSRCITCGTCVEMCNTGSLEMTFTHELAAYAHRDFLKSKEQLFEYSRQKRESQ